MSPTLVSAMKLMDNEYTSGSNSVVEYLLPKQKVVGSNPITRSSFDFDYLPECGRADPSSHRDVVDAVNARLSARETPT